MTDERWTPGAMRAAEQLSPNTVNLGLRARIDGGSTELSDSILQERAALISRETGDLKLARENERLREALLKIANLSEQAEYDADHMTDTGNADDAYDQGRANGYGSCARIAQAALAEQAGGEAKETDLVSRLDKRLRATVKD